MNPTAGLHEHADVIDRHVKQVVGLNNLETFVHERGRVDRDFGPHRPAGVGERLGGGDIRKLIASAPIERTAGTGEPDSGQALAPLAEKALKDGGVFGVDRDEATWPGKRHEDVATGNQRFLVGAGNNLACNQGPMAGPDPSLTNHGDKDAIHIVEVA